MTARELRQLEARINDAASLFRSATSDAERSAHAQKLVGMCAVYCASHMTAIATKLGLTNEEEHHDAD